MIWRWAICFSILPALLASSVTGRVELRHSREKAVRRGLDYSGVVVWLEPLNGPKAGAHPGRATMVQKNKKFVPHILPIRTGTVVEFPNLDPIFHNAFSNFSGQIFDVGLYKPGSTRAVSFNRPGVVRVFCNIHAAMSAVIIVVGSPWFTTTEQNGAFRVTDVPAGEYRLEVFHERSTSEELSRLSRVLTVGTEDLDAGLITISEAGFLPAPHLNKHNKPYSAAPGGYKVMR